MTTGVKTNWGGIWPPMVAGDYFHKSWTGQDRGETSPILPDSARVVERLGLGAAAARDIFTELAEEARSYKHPKSAGNSPEERERAYLERLTQRNNREARNRDIRMKRIVDRDRAKAAAGEIRRQKRREARKAKLPDPFKDVNWAPTRGVRIPVERKVYRYPKELPETPVVNGEHTYAMTYHHIASNNTARLIGKPAHAGPEYATMAYDFHPYYISDIPEIDANDQLELIAQLGENIKGGHGLVANAAAAELPNTIRTIGDTAVRFAKALHHARYGDWSGMARSLLEGTTRAPLPPRGENSWGKVAKDANTISARFLEFRYGIEPLMMDTRAAAQAYAYSTGVRRPRTKSRVRKTLRANGTWRTSWSLEDGTGEASAAWFAVRRRQIIAYFSTEINLSAGDYLGLTDPGSMLQGGWEALPWSFVYDWFVPVGDYLAANAASQFLPQGTYVTTDTWKSTCTSPSGDYVSTPQGVREYVKVARSVTAGLSIPPPEFKSFKETASSRHLQSALALLTQAFTGVTTRIR